MALGGWRLAAFIEAFSRRLRPRASRERPARFIRYDEPRLELDLEGSYYLARGSRGPVLLPYDSYMEQVEELLSICTRHPGDEY